ncbi:MAG: hypothetical protein ABH883_02840 [Candidatus Omnitrophota bacterium]
MEGRKIERCYIVIYKIKRIKMRTIAEKKIEEWTDGIPESSRLVKVFEQIRNIPYYYIPEFFSPDTGPAGMLMENKGFCVPKHYLLGDIFKKLGVPVVFFVCGFYWKENGMDYPRDLRKIAERLPVTYHLACRAEIRAKRVLIDATWDPGLEGAGVFVNKSWDGVNDNVLGVKPLRCFTYNNAFEVESFFLERAKEYSFSDKLNLSRFSKELNLWCEKFRKEK